MIEVYRKKHISIGQQCVDSIGDIEYPSYDVAFFCSSWDCRCLDMSETDFMARQAILVDLSYRDSEGLRDAADQTLGEFINSDSFLGCEVIQQKDRQLNDVLKEMCEYVDRICLDNSSATRVLIDMTGFPRYLSLGLVAYAIKSTTIREVDVFYSEASYGEENETGMISFTEGKWEAVPIPFLEGEYSPCKTMYILVSAGFEGKKTYRAVCEREPDRISILLPQPGFTAGITKRTQMENKKLIEQYMVPDDQILRTPAADLVGTMQALDCNLERFNDENIFYLCCGTKPHSLALALRGCVMDGCAVLYNKPESYKFRPTKQRGKFWLYQIENLAVFS